MRCIIGAIALTNIAMAMRCPKQLDIQVAGLVEKFSIDQFVGDQPYYEIAYHDKTQPLICGCQISRKSMDAEDKTLIHDDGSILCPWDAEDPHYGHVYDQPLRFHTTENPGILDGDWNLTPGVVYPDTVVAVGFPDIAGEPYRWASSSNALRNCTIWFSSPLTSTRDH